MARDPAAASLAGEGGAPRPGVLLFAVLAVTAGLYLNALRGPFVWDDHGLIERSRLSTTLDPRPHLAGAFWDEAATQHADPIYYRPLTTWTYALDRAIGGEATTPFHVTNVLLHLVATALVFALGRRLGAHPIAAALGAAWFGASPRLTECVAWISGRTDVLATTLALGALLLHSGTRANLARTAGAAALLFLGLLAKEVAAAGVAAVAALELARVRRREQPLRAAVAGLVPATLACAAYAVLRHHALAGVQPFAYEPLGHRWIMPIQALGQYALMVLDPRPRLQIGVLGELEPVPLLLGALLLAGGAAALWRARRVPPLPLAAALWAAAAAALVLVLHLVRIRVAVVAADRFLYLPLAALAPLAAVAAARAPARLRRPALAAALALVAVGAATTIRRNEDWSDEVRLWRRAAETTDPRNGLPLNELGNALRVAGRFEEALAAYQRFPRGTQPAPVVLLVRANTANTLAALGRLEEARQELTLLAAEAPALAGLHRDLAAVDLRLLRLDEAEAALARALRLLPGDADALALREEVSRVRRALDALPAERPDEPVDVRLQRARFWTDLGVAPRALPLWRQLLAEPAAPPAALVEGAAYLIVHADRAAAEAAVIRVRAAGVDPRTVEALEAGLADRAAREAAP